MAQYKMSPRQGMQTRSTTHSSYNRGLRRRRLGHYKQDAPYLQCPLKEDEDMNEEPVDYSNKTSSNKTLFGAELGGGDDVIRAHSLAVDERQLSDRESVISCDSYDSGVGSKSDEDGVILPATPDKQTGKPLTIEVVSPNKRGVIELIDNGNDGYIGFFKPSPGGNSNGESSQSTNCRNCALLKHSRITRSISTNNSEDSNDSAFQGFRSNRRNHSKDVAKPLSFVNGTTKVRDKKVRRKNLDAANAKRKSRICKTRQPRKRGRNGTKIASKKQSTSPRFTPKSNSCTKQSVKSNSAKRALMRIQHHNRSPERENDVVTPTTMSARNCRTRSHTKSLLKDILSNTPTTKTSKNVQPKQRNLRKNTFFAKTSLTSFQGPNEPSDNNRSSKLFTNGRSSRCNPVIKDDVGETSDDSQSSSTSACKWRFCKTEVCPADLADHIERLHVASQRRNSRVYKCYWEGCKVYGEIAKSITWLEGHVKRHLGARPYYCIFAGCSAKFPSQELLQRHVDTHIDDVEPVKAAKKYEPAVAKKNDKKKIKRLRGTEKCIPKRTDFFTSNMVEAVRWENKMLQEKWVHHLSEGRDAFKCKGQIVAMTTVDNVERVQLHWFPEELRLPDSWHCRTDEIGSTLTKEVKFSAFERRFLMKILGARTP